MARVMDTINLLIADAQKDGGVAPEALVELHSTVMELISAAICSCDGGASSAIRLHNAIANCVGAE